MIIKEPLFIFMFMIFMHLVADYNLQGWLASAKQKSWWENNNQNELYSSDYKMALLCHAFSWSFLTMLPLAIYHYTILWSVIVLVNMVIHYFIDDQKVNKYSINLMQDQTLHLGQILASFIIYIEYFIFV